MFFAPSRQLAAHRLEHGGPAVYDPRERILLAGFDAALRLASPLLGLRPRADASLTPETAERILALRLDRLGDLLMTLPALRALRAAAPSAHLELAVGSWNEPIARRLPFVDAVRVVDAPWSAWGGKVRLRDTLRALGGGWDLAVDFQGDVRVNVLMAWVKARLRAGYGATGADYLLTQRGAWKPSESWYRQNLELVKSLFPGASLDDEAFVRPYNFLDDEAREEARKRLEALPRPLIGIQPSAGRALKQWTEDKLAALAARLAKEGRGTVVFTGASGDRALVERIVAKAGTRHERLLGLPLLSFAAVLEALDVFVSGDTGPMHMAHAVGTSNVALFGPSDPVRYGPVEGTATRRVVRQSVFCSPCNMIRRPPAECASVSTPECMAGIELEAVLEAVHACVNVRS